MVLKPFDMALYGEFSAKKKTYFPKFSAPPPPIFEIRSRGAIKPTAGEKLLLRRKKKGIFEIFENFKF